MAREEALKHYRQKRHFDSTPEPSGEERSPAKGEAPVFVVQMHDATRLHYDFRIEVAGTLKSWAVPKGPSTNPKEKRLAVPTEDHPLGYAIFEGVIPEGNYGAGPVIVWDIGTYGNLKYDNGKPVPLEESVEKGHLTIYLEGQKLHGGFALTRFKEGKDESWLLVKMDDEHAQPERDIVEEEPRSVISGKTIEELAADPPSEDN